MWGCNNRKTCSFNRDNVNLRVGVAIENEIETKYNLIVLLTDGTQEAYIVACKRIREALWKSKGFY